MTNTQLYYASVAQFMRTFNQKCYTATSKTPESVRHFRGDLIEEEYNEYRAGCKSDNRLEMLDGLCDLVYVAAGTLLTFGLQVIPYSAKAPIIENHLEAEALNAIDECYQPIPCHKRCYAAMNKLLIRADQIGKKFNLPEAFRVVHENNMDKLWKSMPTGDGLIAIPKGEKKWLVKNSEGKVIKPPNHPRPDLKKFIV